MTGSKIEHIEHTFTKSALLLSVVKFLQGFWQGHTQKVFLIDFT
jgi:hypothetical protein